MPTPNQVKLQINKLISRLVEIGFADDQCFAFQRQTRNKTEEITFKGAESVPIALKDRAYNEIYRQLVEERAYNVKMLDGALLQMMYIFNDKILQRHRLVFFSAPHLEEFQNNPDVYLEDEIHADIVARNIVPFPVRFDYDARANHYQELAHPKSHLSLGQYEHCRIPVSAPMTPSWFVDFILRNFYHTAFSQYADQLPAHSSAFPKSILPPERDIVHVVVPA